MRPILASLFGSLLCVAACQSPPKAKDLGTHEGLYQATGYRSGYTQPRSVYIAPLVDRRETPPTHGEGVYPRTYTQDHFWARSVATMLQDVIHSEIGASAIFTTIAPDEASADWVLEPSLLSFYGCVEERVVGRTVRGFTKLHLVVKGQPAADGKRPILRTRSYEAPTTAGGMMFVPDPHALAGASLRRAIVLMLIDLENGGRKLDGVATEAQFEADKVQEWKARSDQK